MPLGFMLLDHIAANYPLLEVTCHTCERHTSLPTEALVARHGRCVSVQELLRIVAQGCPRWRGFEVPNQCEVRFPQLERRPGSAAWSDI
jgi:hypothetical protein